MIHKLLSNINRISRISSNVLDLILLVSKASEEEGGRLRSFNQKCEVTRNNLTFTSFHISVTQSSLNHITLKVSFFLEIITFSSINAYEGRWHKISQRLILGRTKRGTTTFYSKLSFRVKTHRKTQHSVQFHVLCSITQQTLNSN